MKLYVVCAHKNRLIEAILTILLKIEKAFPSLFPLPPDLALWSIRIDSIYPCLERISINPKMFELLKLDCNNTRILRKAASYLLEQKSQDVVIK